MAAGNLSLGPIHKLPDHWWTSQPPNDHADVWKVWGPNTYYLWGANSGNYKGIALGDPLGGGGMASDPAPASAAPTQTTSASSPWTSTTCPRMIPSFRISPHT